MNDVLFLFYEKWLKIYRFLVTYKIKFVFWGIFIKFVLNEIKVNLDCGMVLMIVDLLLRKRNKEDFCGDFYFYFDYINLKSNSFNRKLSKRIIKWDLG